jgi:GGDEF domain-containing protein
MNRKYHFGYLLADRLIINLTQRLNGFLPVNSVLYRIIGVQFAVIITELFFCHQRDIL